MIYTYDFYPIDSRMHVLLENEKALIIDPCVSDDALRLLQENKVTEIFVLLSHEHYDHIFGVNWLRENFPAVHVMCSSECAQYEYTAILLRGGQYFCWRKRNVLGRPFSFLKRNPRAFKRKYLYLAGREYPILG